MTREKKKKKGMTEWLPLSISICKSPIRRLSRARCFMEEEIFGLGAEQHHSFVVVVILISFRPLVMTSSTPRVDSSASVSMI